MEKKKVGNQSKVPAHLQDIEKWETNRRSFLRAALIAGAASQLAWFTSCSAKLEQANEYLSAEQSTILKSVLNILWPDDGNGPSVDDLNTFGYFMWILSSEYTPEEDKDFVIEGIDWIDEKSREIYAKNYFDLDQKEQEILVAQIIEQDYGSNVMSVLINYILESLILDPVYGGNKDEAGWKWLDHETGQPQPTEKTRVEAIYQKYLPNV